MAAWTSPSRPTLSSPSASTSSNAGNRLTRCSDSAATDPTPTPAAESSRRRSPSTRCPDSRFTVVRSRNEHLLELNRGANPADFLGPNPWGDLNAYRREVCDPRQSPRRSVAAGAREATKVSISLEELPRMNEVLGALYEGYAGGIPWPGIDDDERGMLERLA